MIFCLHWISAVLSIYLSMHSFICFFFCVFFSSSSFSHCLRSPQNINQMINNGLHLMQILQKILANGGRVQLDKWLILLHKISCSKINCQPFWRNRTKQKLLVFFLVIFILIFLLKLLFSEILFTWNDKFVQISFLNFSLFVLVMCFSHHQAYSI